MLRISQLKLNVGHTENEMKKKILQTLRIKEQQLLDYSIRKRSLDARHKPELYYVYTIDATVADEQGILKRVQKKKGNTTVTLCKEEEYRFPRDGQVPLKERPVVVGCGPAGIFCAYFLAKYGMRPILIERGSPVEERQKDVERFWETGVLIPNSNVQFGEGGAGAFSDGKLNTLVKDPCGRIRKVLEIFVEHGAPEEILYDAKPHIGTDILCDVIRSMRNQILSWGGEVHFHTKMTALILDKEAQTLNGIRIEVQEENERKEKELKTQILVMAPGHSARDTFRMLYEMHVPMEAKAFAVGVRAEHPQELINLSQYGNGYPKELPSAAYKLTAKLPSGRGVYSFCMCPGGYVVNASSEEGMLAVNGMSYHARDSHNANSAIVVTVSPEDYGSSHPLAGIAFQRKLERAAFEAGKGRIPVQRFGEFKENVEGNVSEKDVPESRGEFKDFSPCMKGKWENADLTQIFPKEISKSLASGIEEFDAKIRGFSHPDTILSAVESRTSSPVRILRDSSMESCICGLYPCGEGAGYAGGITSAAVDGIKIAETICGKFASFDKSEDGLRKN
ncbi:MAG: FAD-dependent oxidoreductase [Bariatricus sp.]|nr:FAD-dependent oxidoreductase [Bariatricus sp.]